MDNEQGYAYTESPHMLKPVLISMDKHRDMFMYTESYQTHGNMV